MRIRSLAFAGYRSFAARSPAAPERPLERLKLAPLTLVLGKNNSGKSTALRLLHHFLLAIGNDSKDPFPMVGRDQPYGRNFLQVQHNNAFFNPVDLDAELVADNGSLSRFTAQLIQLSGSADDPRPVISDRTLNGTAYPAEDSKPRGLLPDVSTAQLWRDGARRLLDASCHLGPIRDSVHDVYDVNRNATDDILPNKHDNVARLLLTDSALRSSVGDWMEKHLEGWRIDVRQTLDMFNLVVRREKRESNLASAGQGIQQVLPVVALCCWRNLGRGESPFLDIIEQPELHLHDAAHAPLGDLLLSAVEKRNGNLVVETHSEALVLRVRRRIAEGSISPDQVALVYVEDEGDGSRIKPIPITPDGDVEWWPEGVFSESFVEVKAIRAAQRARGSG